MNEDILDQKAKEHGVNLTPTEKEVARLIMVQAQAERNQYSAQVNAIREQVEAERQAREAEAEQKRLQTAHDQNAQKLEVYRAFYRARWVMNGGSEYEFSKVWEGLRQSIIMGVIDPEAEIRAEKLRSGVYHEYL